MSGLPIIQGNIPAPVVLEPPTPLAASLVHQFDEIVARYEQPRAALLPVLHAAQDFMGYISSGVEQSVAQYMSIPLVDVHEVVTFYSLYHKKPYGKYWIQLCRTTSCWLRGGEDIEAHIKNKLGIEAGQTTEDGRFTFETAECLCACEKAPMMSVNGKYYGPLTPPLVDEILGGLA